MLTTFADALDGELGVLVETIDPARGPEFGGVGQVEGRPVVSVRDATSAGRRVRRPAGGSGGRPAGPDPLAEAAMVCLEKSCDRAAGLSSTTRSEPAAARHGGARADRHGGDPGAGGG